MFAIYQHLPVFGFFILELQVERTSKSMDERY
jgi:hypothetical protein